MASFGLVRTSFVDFPGRICSTIFTRGCVFRCGYCHNPELVLHPDRKQGEFFSFEECLKLIEERKHLIDGVCITGGEPTLYKKLIELCVRTKEFGLAVKLDTNGTHPDVLIPLIQQQLVDYIAMDIKGPLRRYSEIVHAQVDTEKIKQSIKLIMNAGCAYEFRTTVTPKDLVSEDIAEMAQEIAGAQLVTLQQFKPDITLDKQYMKVIPYTYEDFQEFKAILLKHVQRVAITGFTRNEYPPVMAQMQQR